MTATHAPTAFTDSVSRERSTSRLLRLLAVLVMVGGVILTLGGGVTWGVVQSQLADEKITVAEDVLRAYVGEYQLTPQLSLSITLENGRLQAQPTGQSKATLFAEAQDLFFLRVVNAQVRFTRGASGEVTGLAREASFAGIESHAMYARTTRAAMATSAAPSTGVGKRWQFTRVPHWPTRWITLNRGAIRMRSS